MTLYILFTIICFKYYAIIGVMGDNYMKISAIFLILLFLFSSCSQSVKEVAAKKLVVLREIKEADGMRMKNLEKLSSLYKIRGKSSKSALNDFAKEVEAYLAFLIEKAPLVRVELAWFEQNNIPCNLKLSLFLTGGKTISERENNEKKGLYDVRMYKKRIKNVQQRISKKEPLSFNEIKNIKHPLK